MYYRRKRCAVKGETQEKKKEGCCLSRQIKLSIYHPPKDRELVSQRNGVDATSFSFHTSEELIHDQSVQENNISLLILE